jgi:SlyX protein
MRAMDELTALQERVAHQDRIVEELSDVVTAQARRIETLERRVAMLMQREAERESDAPGGVVLGNETPPHY